MAFRKIFISLMVMFGLIMGACSSDEPQGNDPAGGGGGNDTPSNQVSPLVGIWQNDNDPDEYWQFKSDNTGVLYESYGNRQPEYFTYVDMGQQVVMTFGTGMDAETEVFQYTISNGKAIVISEGKTMVFTKVNQLPGNGDNPPQSTVSPLVGIWHNTNDPDEYWQFKSDNTGVLYESYGNREPEYFTYVDMGQQVVITFGTGMDAETEVFQYSISNGMAIVTVEGETMVFIKVDSLPGNSDNPADLNTELQRARRLIIGMWTAIVTDEDGEHIMAILFSDNGLAVMASQDLYSNEDTEYSDYSYSVEIRQGKINLGMKYLGEENRQWQYYNLSFPDDNTMVWSGFDEEDGSMHTMKFNRYIED